MDLVGRRSAEPRLFCLIDKAKRNQRRSIDRAGHRQSVIDLIILNRLPRYPAQHAINRFAVITELLQRVLHIGDDLVRRQTIIPIDRPIVSVVRIIGIVTVSWIPISQVPRVEAAAEYIDGMAVIPPPIPIMTISMPW